MRGGRLPHFEVVADRPSFPLVIRDVGPWDAFPTVTNAAEAVVVELRRRGMLPTGRRLFYYDSEGVLDEIVHDAVRGDGSGSARFRAIRGAEALELEAAGFKVGR